MCNARACDAPAKILSDTVRWVTSKLSQLELGSGPPVGSCKRTLEAALLRLSAKRLLRSKRLLQA